MSIDVHTHAFPDKIAKRAIKKLSEMGDWSAVGKGTVKDLIKSMDRADIDVSVVCPIATKPDQAEGILAWCKEIRSDRIEPFPSVHPDTPDAAGWVKRFAEEGFAGIKLHPMYQEFQADEDRLDPIYAAAVETGLAVTLHCGRDIAFDPEDDRAGIGRLRRIIDRHAGIRMICTHMGGWKAWDEVRELLIGQDVWLETSFSLRFLDPADAKEMILAHGVDRVMMGSDWPWNDQREEIEAIKTLGLDEDDQRKILFSNAAKLLGY
jgi:hypothetical protein